MKKLIIALILTIPLIVNAQSSDGYVTGMKYIIDDQMFIFKPGVENSNVYFNDGHIGINVNDTLHFNFHFNGAAYKADGFTYFYADLSIIHNKTENRKTFERVKLGIKEPTDNSVLINSYFGEEGSLSLSIIHNL